MRMSSRWMRVASAGGAVLGLCACPKVPTSSAGMQQAPNVDVSADQLQVQTYAMGHVVNGSIERAADSILNASSDPQVRRRAILWKLSATPLVQEASLRNDPLVAVVDLAAFTEQQTAYFTTGEGRQTFGALQPVAVDASQRMQREVVGLMQRSVKGNELPAEATARLAAWTAEHPMTGPDLQRASVLGADWTVLGASNESVVGTVVNMDRTLRGLALRLGYLNETLSAQLQWNAQLLADEMVNSPRGDSLLRPGASTIRAVGISPPARRNSSRASVWPCSQAWTASVCLRSPTSIASAWKRCTRSAASAWRSPRRSTASGSR